jgi:hypothetical protein
VAVLTFLFVAAAAPTLAADPSPAPPGHGNKPDHAGPKDKAPKEPITVSGAVTKATDDDGETVYQLTAGGKTYTLDAGPAWFMGDDHPLASRVGDTVTIVGEVAAGSANVEVQTIDGTAVRAGGKPPWAGGWKAVGEKHPGWTADKAARVANHLTRLIERFGCFPPGQCKKGEPAASE